MDKVDEYFHYGDKQLEIILKHSVTNWGTDTLKSQRDKEWKAFTWEVYGS